MRCRTIAIGVLLLFITPAHAQRATLQDSLAVYKNALAVQAFYEKSGAYRKVAETRLKSNDPFKMHYGNDVKYQEVLKTINNDRLTTSGKRKIRPDEYRINIDQYHYRQRELSDYVLNTNAPMQLFDRRIAPQFLMDYTSVDNALGMTSSDDVDFKMYDPIAVKPWSMLTPEEKVLRNTRYPPAVAPPAPPPLIVKRTEPAPAVKPKPVKPKPAPKKIADAPAKSDAGTEFIILGDVPDSLRFRRFKSRREAEEFVKSLPEGEE